MSRNRLLAIVLTAVTTLATGVPVAQAHGWGGSGYYAYRGYVPQRRVVSFRFAAGRTYWRTRPRYAYVRRYSPYYRRVVRYRPYRAGFVDRFVVYRRSC
jgi:hypothetical protein